MHREDRLAGQLCLVDLLGEKPLAARLDEGAVLDTVAGAGQAQDREEPFALRPVEAAGGDQARLDIAGLYECERGTPCGDRLGV